MGRGSTSPLAGSAVFGLECDIESSLNLMTDTHLVWFGAKLLIRKEGRASQGRTRDVMSLCVLLNDDERLNSVSRAVLVILALLRDPTLCAVLPSLSPLPPKLIYLH